MSSQDESHDPTALTPAREAAVRRLLASVRVTEPIPAEVAGRLHETLVALAATGATQSTEATHLTEPAQPTVAAEPGARIDSLERARSRRRVGTRLLAAAATVAVLAVAAPPMMRSVTSVTGSADSAGGSAAGGSESAEGATSSKTEAGPDSADTLSDDPGPAAPDQEAGGDQVAPDGTAIAAAAVVRSQRVEVDVRRALSGPPLMQELRAARLPALPVPTEVSERYASSSSGQCDLPASLDDRAALPIVWREKGSRLAGALVLPADAWDTLPGEPLTGTVEVWLCGETQPRGLVSIP